jgi:hypothetical protein
MAIRSSLCRTIGLTIRNATIAISTTVAAIRE